MAEQYLSKYEYEDFLDWLKKNYGSDFILKGGGLTGAYSKVRGGKVEKVPPNDASLATNHYYLTYIQSGGVQLQKGKAGVFDLKKYFKMRLEGIDAGVKNKKITEAQSEELKKETWAEVKEAYSSGVVTNLPEWNVNETDFLSERLKVIKNKGKEIGGFITFKNEEGETEYFRRTENDYISVDPTYAQLQIKKALKVEETPEEKKHREALESAQKWRMSQAEASYEEQGKLEKELQQARGQTEFEASKARYGEWLGKAQLQREQMANEAQMKREEMAWRGMQTLSELQSKPRNWIQAWMYGNALQNRLASMRPAPTNAVQSRAYEQSWLAKNTPSTEWTPPANYDTYLPAMAEQLRQAQPMPAPGEAATSAHASRLEGRVQPPIIEGMPIPSWLVKFVPQLANKDVIPMAGYGKYEAPYAENVPKYPVAETPSLQKWATVPETQRLGLGGYMDYTGQIYEDMLSEMERSRTETPRGAGREAWIPRRMRV